MGVIPGELGVATPHFEVGLPMLSNPQNLKIFQKIYCAPEPRITVKVSKVVCGWGSAPDPVYTRPNARHADLLHWNLGYTAACFFLFPYTVEGRLGRNIINT
jgi:hypothetical protein